MSKGESSHAWLVRALHHLTSDRAPVVSLGGEEANGVAPLARQPRTFVSPPGLGPHSNLANELCIALEGWAVMMMEDRLFPLVPPTLAIVGAGMRHCEGTASPSRGYALLWMGVSKSSIYLVVSRYTPRRGWDNPWRYGFHDGSVPGLDQALRAPRGPRYLERVGAELVAVMAALHRDVTVHGAARTEASQRQAMLQHLHDYLETHLDQPISLAQVAAFMKLAPNYLNSLFRRWKGRGIHRYLIERRMEKALQLGRRGDIAVKEMALAVGYADPLYFSRAFHRHHGYWPSDLKKRRSKG